jgi:hypothetical protein
MLLAPQNAASRDSLATDDGFHRVRAVPRQGGLHTGGLQKRDNRQRRAFFFDASMMSAPSFLVQHGQAVLIRTDVRTFGLQHDSA